MSEIHWLLQTFFLNMNENSFPQWGITLKAAFIKGISSSKTHKSEQVSPRSFHTIKEKMAAAHHFVR